MEILFHGVATKTNGTPVKVGEKLPAFTVKDAADTVKTGTQLFTKVSLISVVPDIDTRVCSLSTKRFNQEVDKYNNINFDSSWEIAYYIWLKDNNINFIFNLRQ